MTRCSSGSRRTEPLVVLTAVDMEGRSTGARPRLKQTVARLHSFEGSNSQESTLLGDATAPPARKVRPLRTPEGSGVAASVARGGLRVLCGVAIIAAFALAPTAKAAVRDGGPTSYCDPTSSQVFSRFGDSAYYARMMNGGFENGSTGWVLSGGARVVSGNEPYYLTGNTSDSHSLLLPAGSSAYSGTVCFKLGDWH